MTHKLIPRFSPGQAAARLEQIQVQLASGKRALELVQTDFAGAVPNATGGEAPTHTDLGKWRKGIMDTLDGLRTGSKAENDIHAMELGRALNAIIAPSPSDAAHDGVWSFLALVVFPDVVHARWPADPVTRELSKDRWIGRQVGRDRNYLKLSWRRWQVLGPVMEHATPTLGEDEFGALLERSSVARNTRLVRIAAQEIVAFRDEGARTEFARALMKRITQLTGPLNLDILSDEELVEIVRDCAITVLSLGSPRRSISEYSTGDGNDVTLSTPAPRRANLSRHTFTRTEESDGKIRTTCACGFTVRRRRSGVERIEALHRQYPSQTDAQLSRIQPDLVDYIKESTR